MAGCACSSFHGAARVRSMLMVLRAALSVCRKLNLLASQAPFSVLAAERLDRRFLPLLRLVYYTVFAVTLTRQR